MREGGICDERCPAKPGADRWVGIAKHATDRLGRGSRSRGCGQALIADGAARMLEARARKPDGGGNISQPPKQFVTNLDLAHLYGDKVLGLGSAR